MQVEESGNMIWMSLHYAQLAGSTRATPWLQRHYKIMKQWAGFLVDDSLVPAEQLSTDDFAGTLANQTNLAIKGIVGIGAMSKISDLCGQSKDSESFYNTSRQYVQLWANYSISADKSHLKLSYQNDSSWGTLYNVLGDRLLNLQLVPKSIYTILDNWYPKVIEKYGLPLDSRHKWGKSDWAIFAAAASASTDTKNKLINRLYTFMSNGLTDSPFTDLYETTTGDTPKEPYDPMVHFLARPVVGGLFSLMVREKADKANGITNYKYAPEFPYGADQGKKKVAAPAKHTGTLRRAGGMKQVPFGLGSKDV